MASWNAKADSNVHRSQRPGAGAPRTSRRPQGSLRPKSATNLALGQQRSDSSSPSLPPRSGRPSGAPPVDEEEWFGSRDTAEGEDAAAQSMAALVGRIVGAKPFPESARRLADLTRADVVRIDPVIQVLERDPALSARLLRLVNSAGYALRQRCTSVRHAATLVGTDRLHQIATTAAVLDLFDSRGGVATRIVEHSTLVGAFCRYLGAHLALPVDDLFTAGFLHDIGKLMLLETEGDAYVQLLEQTDGTPDAIYLLERETLGFDHAMLAAHVLRAWNIPDPVPKIVSWHHDPARAFHASSLMAAMVQTVRLADAAVYVMGLGVDAEALGKLAHLESASFLDISEAQLATMWEELRVLHDQSIEQCREKNAPALDPRSLRPKNPLSISSGARGEQPVDLPLQFPCVVCSHPTFGNTCPACGGHVCPDHQHGREAWCSLCASDYRREAGSTPVPGSVRYSLFLALAAVMTSGAIGMATAGRTAAMKAGFGTLLLIALIGVLWVAGRRLVLRFHFVRTRPNRYTAAPRGNDGGVLSLVPPGVAPIDPFISDTGEQDSAEPAPIVMHEPMLAAPSRQSLPAVAVHDSWLCGSERPGPAEPLRIPQPIASHFEPSPMASASRIEMQGQSLVTLPAPARPSEEEDPDLGLVQKGGRRQVRRRARDTLRGLTDDTSPVESAPPPESPAPKSQTVPAAARLSAAPSEEPSAAAPQPSSASSASDSPVVSAPPPFTPSEELPAPPEPEAPPGDTAASAPAFESRDADGDDGDDGDPSDLSDGPRAVPNPTIAPPEDEAAPSEPEAVGTRAPLVARQLDTMAPPAIRPARPSTTSSATMLGLERSRGGELPSADFPSVPSSASPTMGRNSHPAAVSIHPLAALGLVPPVAQEPPSPAVFSDVSDSVKPEATADQELRAALTEPLPEPEDSALLTPSTSLAAEPVVFQAATTAVEPSPSPEPVPMELGPAPVPAAVVAEPDVVETPPVPAPLKKRPRARRPKAKVEPPAPQPLPPASPTGDALADMMASQLSGQLGPEFQAKVLSMVAERVASLVAERMASTLVGGAAPAPAPNKGKGKSKGKGKQQSA